MEEAIRMLSSWWSAWSQDIEVPLGVKRVEIWAVTWSRYGWVEGEEKEEL